MNISTGYVQAYHLGIQRSLGKNSVLDVAYIGEHGVKIWDLADLNQAAPNVPSATCNANVSSSCISLLNRRPVKGFTDIYATNNYGFLRYNGLQVKLEHRYQRGLYMLNSFTYSRVIDNASGHLDAPNGDNSNVNLANLRGDVGQSAYNQPLNDTLTVIWDLPYGHGRMFGASSGRILQSMLGGWQISAINTATSGIPFNLTYTPAAQFEITDLLSQRPNVTGNPVTQASQRIKTGTSISNYLNSINVSVPTDVSQPYGNAGRNSLRGPTFNQLTLGVHKAFPLWNDFSNLDLRAEAFNTLNHVNYNAPDSNRSDSGFGAITSSAPARQLQLAMKVIF